jgi:archaemetzincin
MAVEAARAAEAVDLLPIGVLPLAALQSLAARLSGRIALPCHLLPALNPPFPRIAGRENQLDAGAVLRLVETRPAPPGRVIVGVTAEDIAIPIFTFVFGLARQGGRACLVSLARGDPAFYGLQEDPELRDSRAVAEVLHELGHLALLDHCPDRTCLMSFAGNVEKVDARGSRFCEACTARLPPWLAVREQRPEST